jgi:DNA-binding MarR family transcriptional regulator
VKKNALKLVTIETNLLFMTQTRTLEDDLTPDEQDVAAAFELTNFFPYLVRVYYRAVSEAVSNVYSSRYNLSMSEWRTMVVLGPNGALSASEIVARSSMDKVNVSRAIKGLQKIGFLRRDIDGQDKRRAVLRLTEKGSEALAVLVPLVRQVEENLLTGLSGAERKTLIDLMDRVRSNTENLNG